MRSYGHFSPENRQKQRFSVGKTGFCVGKITDKALIFNTSVGM